MVEYHDPIGGRDTIHGALQKDLYTVIIYYDYIDKEPLNII
jgi:hypothetical protein